MNDNELRKEIDNIVFRLLAQGHYWGTGSGDDGKLDKNYEPDKPIDRTEAVKIIENLIAAERTKWELEAQIYALDTLHLKVAQSKLDTDNYKTLSVLLIRWKDEYRNDLTAQLNNLKENT